MAVAMIRCRGSASRRSRRPLAAQAELSRSIGCHIILYGLYITIE
jgi:hypothetical protein